MPQLYGLPAALSRPVTAKILFTQFIRLNTTSADYNLSVSKKLFTPGPLNCSETVKRAMLQDVGSRDVKFMETVRFIRQKLLQIAGVSDKVYTAVPVQGSGTYANEAVLNTSTPKNNGKVLVLANGFYGKRLSDICQTAGIDVHTLSFSEVEVVDVAQVEHFLKNVDVPIFTTVAVVHSETTSGILNPVQDIGILVKQYLPNASYFVDAMSSFGAIPIDMDTANVDFMVGSANKCLEGVPGFAYVIAKLDRLLTCKGNSRSLCLDLEAQYTNLESNGQFQFTPPTHTMLAFQQALIEFEQEGGLSRRADRYAKNKSVLSEGMKELGFEELLIDQPQGCIITTYRCPTHPNFHFETFYKRLADLGQIIYPGKITNSNCFRIGTIGQLYESDMRNLLFCIERVCKDMNISLKDEKQC